MRSPGYHLMELLEVKFSIPVLVTSLNDIKILIEVHMTIRIRYRTRCPLCCFLDSHFVVSVTPFAVSVAHFVEMYSHFVDSVTHFVVSDQQSGNVYFQNVIRRPEC